MLLPSTYGRLCFHRPLSVNGGGGFCLNVSVPRSLPSLWSHVIGGGGEGGGCTPVPARRVSSPSCMVLQSQWGRGGYPFPSQGYPSPVPAGGILPSNWCWIGYTSPPPAGTGLEYPLAGTGGTPTGTGYVAVGIPLVVSRRRTFLF